MGCASESSAWLQFAATHGRAAAVSRGGIMMPYLFFAGAVMLLVWLGIPWPVALGIVAAYVFLADRFTEKT
jgi:hypothetical protein